MSIVKQLIGHTSEDTAYLVGDYPYGYTARTSIRYWVETKPKLGQRFVSQTLNPKTKKWNKPKASTYKEALVIGLNEEGHVTYTSVNTYSGYEGFKEFFDKYQLDEYQQEKIGNIVRRFEQVHAKQKELAAAGEASDLSSAFKACVLADIARLERGEELAA